MTERTRNVRAAASFRFALCFGLAATALAGPLISRAHADEHDRWRRERHEWREGYYHRPDVYYSAPPVVYPPYGYYAQPRATFSFSFPIR